MRFLSSVGAAFDSAFAGWSPYLILVSTRDFVSLAYLGR